MAPFLAYSVIHKKYITLQETVMNDFARLPLADTDQLTLEEEVGVYSQPAPISEAMVYGDLFAKAFFSKKSNPHNRIKPEHLALAMRKIDAVSEREVVFDGRKMLMLSSNNYLGLASDSRLSEAGIQAIQEWGNSTSGSRLLNGTNELHEELERKLANFKQVESVVAFQSGYMANLGAISALLSKDDVAIVDKLVHASILDGCTLAGAQVRSFKHQDMKSLERVLQDVGYKACKLIVVDGIYSMDGDFAKLPEIMALARRYGARVMVDDAHATGVAGPNGRGTAEHFGINEPDVITGTLSKAFGCIGGFVGAKKDVMDFIKFNSRAFIYSTSISPAVTASLIKALDIIEHEQEKRLNLWACTHHLLNGLKAMGFNTGVSETPIVPIILSNEFDMFELVARLDGDDIFASPVAYPACPRNKPRVRISLSSEHTIADMDRVLDACERHGRAMGLIL
jgi:8-amino-7-oxononanoate synthase